MNRAEIAQLLGLAAARDRRTVGTADVAAWFEDLGDLDFADARAALGRHFRETTDWLMPAHIRRHVKALRAERREVERHEIRELPSRFENDIDRAVRVEAGLAQCSDILRPLMDELARRRKKGTEEDPKRQRALERARRERRQP
jgi:hypothetical protein